MIEFNSIWKIIGPQQNRTKCSKERARSLYYICCAVMNEEMPGDFVEVGTWKGGMSAMMARMCQEEGKLRKTYALDSFQGMSEANTDLDLLEGETEAKACLEPKVQLRNFNRKDFDDTLSMLSVEDKYIEVHEGWVEDTLPNLEIGDISVLRIDVDWYEPTKQVLEALYDKVVEGGFIICDDYGAWKGARKAIDDFRRANRLEELLPLIQTVERNDERLIVSTEHFWRK